MHKQGRHYQSIIPTDETDVADALGRVLTLGGANLDSDVAWESIAGLAGELKANERFSKVKEFKDFRAETDKGLFCKRNR
ncbi:MAG TPA: hypothetical protein PLX08_09490 [Bacteroidales bacterium]|jgi:hypothetical protein|nr:hypothetical protein [Bacteroidales bacterium]